MNGDYIDAYLAQLRAALSTPPARTVEIVAEAEDHLRESAAARQADGLGAAAAQRAAIAAFGPVRQVSRAHRPTVADYTASAALRAWPLLAAFLVLNALVGGVRVWNEVVVFGGVMVPAAFADGETFFNPQGTADPAQLAATLGGCALAGLLVHAGFLAARRRWRRSVAALAPLPVTTGPGAGARPGAARADKTLLAGEARRAAAAALGPARPARGQRIPVYGYTAEGVLDAAQWLGSYLLLAALTSGVMVYAEGYHLTGVRDNPARWEAVCACCGLAGSLLFAGVQYLRRRRGMTGSAPARLPRWLSLPVITAWLVLVAVVEYRVFSRNVMGNLQAAVATRPDTQEIYWLVLGAQFAAVLMALGSVARGLAFLGRWLRPERPAAARGNPPENADLAPVR